MISCIINQDTEAFITCLAIKKWYLLRYLVGKDKTNIIVRYEDITFTGELKPYKINIDLNNLPIGVLDIDLDYQGTSVVTGICHEFKSESKGIRFYLPVQYLASFGRNKYITDFDISYNDGITTMKLQSPSGTENGFKFRFKCTVFNRVMDY